MLTGDKALLCCPGGALGEQGAGREGLGWLQSLAPPSQSHPLTAAALQAPGGSPHRWGHRAAAWIPYPQQLCPPAPPLPSEHALGVWGVKLLRYEGTLHRRLLFSFPDTAAGWESQNHLSPK